MDRTFFYHLGRGGEVSEVTDPLSLAVNFLKSPFWILFETTDPPSVPSENHVIHQIP